MLELDGFDTATSSNIDVVCTTADDGEFTLPQATQAEVGENFTAFLDLSRVVMSYLIQGDALLTVVNRSSVAE